MGNGHIRAVLEGNFFGQIGVFILLLSQVEPSHSTIDKQQITPDTPVIFAIIGYFVKTKNKLHLDQAYLNTSIPWQFSFRQ